MKKIMMLLLAVVLMLGVSGKAMAYFGGDELIRVEYTANNGSGTEYATDLGNYTSLLSSVYTGPSILLNTSNAPANLSTGYVAYFMVDYQGTNTVNGQAWTSGALTNSGVSNAASFGIFEGGVASASAGFGSVGTTQTVSLAQSNLSSYWNQMDGGGAGIGSAASFLNSIQHVGMDQSLAGLSGPGYVDQYLYYYGSTPDAGGQGTPVAILQTNANGSTTILGIPPSVPIPAAIYLFGSSLLGLVGLRRKMSV